MLVLHDFKCLNKKCDVDIVEKLVHKEQWDLVLCPCCGLPMTRQVSSPGLVKSNFHDSPKVKGY